MASLKTTFLLLSFNFLLLSTKFISLEAICSNSSAGNTTVGCIEMERQALLKFKEGLKDPSSGLSSWVGRDCCTWLGVGCNNQTGHVIKLDLKSQPICNQVAGSVFCKVLSLGGELSPSLLDLKYLNYLDLSYNDFQGIPIPNFIGSLNKLSYLDLSYAFFDGTIPPHLGNLSNLYYLNLSTFLTNLSVSNLNWLSGLSSLQYLSLISVNLSEASTHWLQVVNTLPSLIELHLSGCKLQNLPQTLQFVNFTSLSVLDLSYNNFSSSLIPHWLFNITGLTNLQLSHCNLKGSIPEIAIGSLCNLQSLDISVNYYISGEIAEFFQVLSGCSNSSLEQVDFSWNMLTGNLPYSLGYFKGLKSLLLSVNSFSGLMPANIRNLSGLEELDLSYNKMNGTILESIGHLTELTLLNLFSNSWEGVISEIHFQNLAKLNSFSLSSTEKLLVLNVSHDWIPSFDLTHIEIDHCQLGPAFPSWLRTQKNLLDISLTNAAIVGKIPKWLWNLSSQIFNLDLSHNQLSGNLPGSLNFTLFTSIDLSYNLLEGSLPLWAGVTGLYLRNNSLSGEIPIQIYQEMPQLQNIDLSVNFLNGSIPSSINKLNNLSFIDLSNNHFSGEIHDHWKGMQNLYAVDLSKNKLSGGIPNSMCSLPSLFWLHLSNNNLSGDLSLSLKNCSHKLSLDLGENRFTGTMPKWIGERFFSLAALRLRGNKLSGNIPEELCSLSDIHVLDLGHNNFSGSIPTCLGRLDGYKYLYRSLLPLDHDIFKHAFIEHMDLVAKGRQLDYGDPILNTIDLSENNLSGEVPIEITNLSALDTLNLSFNHLTGKIPENIGDLQYLETLDLSCNDLSGPIPQSMTSITTLSSLNLSYNDLSGQIPTANQFHTFNDPSVYAGNLQLCGPPLPTTCSTPSDEGAEHKDQENFDGNDEGSEDLWFYVSIALGFIVGFWAVCGTLVVKKSWRHAYFHFVYEMKDRIFVAISVNMTRLRRKIESEH